ncbi:MAG: cytochrome B6, partial [Thermoanaerobaculia bacterium]
MKLNRTGSLALLGAGTLAAALAIYAAEPAKVASSYGPTNQDVTFSQIKAARLAVKAERAKAHAALLASRYELKAAVGDTLMSGGKAVPAGPTARLAGTSWEQLDKMSPEQIKEKGLFPYQPLPFPDHAEGGMLFPKMTIDVLPRLTRFDLDFDLP